MALNERLATTTRSCNHGAIANARVEASCATEAGHLSFGVTASADRAGGCGSCAESSSVAAFEWRTRAPSQSHAALFLKGTQTRGTAGAKRCTLQVGAETRSWADVEAGIVRTLDERGRAVSRTYSADVQLREYLAKRAAKLMIHAACTGSVQRLYGFGSNPPPALALTVH